MGSASPPANDPRKDEVCVDAGRLVMDLLERGLRPQDILTRESFENAIAAVAARGGPTNPVLHLPAPAPEGGDPPQIKDLDPDRPRTHGKANHENQSRPKLMSSFF